MEFPLGYDLEASIYANSVKMTVNRHLSSNSQLNSEVNMVTNDINNNSAFYNIDLNNLVNFLLRKTTKSVKEEGWRLDDEDGIGWYLGLYITAYLRSKRPLYDFDTLFKTAFIRHFKSL